MHFYFFIFILPAAVLLILLFTTRQKSDSDSEPSDPVEVCALCQNDFPINQLLEKEVGTYGKIYCFCEKCIEQLYNEFKNQNEIQTGE